MKLALWLMLPVAYVGGWWYAHTVCFGLFLLVHLLDPRAADALLGPLGAIASGVAAIAAVSVPVWLAPSRKRAVAAGAFVVGVVHASAMYAGVLGQFYVHRPASYGAAVLGGALALAVLWARCDPGRAQLAAAGRAAASRTD